MTSKSIDHILDELETEHRSIRAADAKIRRVIGVDDQQARQGVFLLNKLVKKHFLREDMELYPMVIKLFNLTGGEVRRANLFESDREKSIREKYGHGNILENFWESEYDDRDMKSELISFAKITLQVFEILSEYMRDRSGGKKRSELNAKVLGVLHILEARMEYEEEELFPRIRSFK